MEFKLKSNQILGDFKGLIEKPSLIWIIWVVCLVLVVLFSFYALYLQITEGHVVTGMRDHVVWGLYVANFIFFLGLSYAGAIIGAFFHLFKVPWRRPVIRIASLIAIVGAMVGPFYIFLCIGRFDRLHYLFVYPRLQSPIVWDVFAISTYLVAAILFLYTGLIKDFAVLRDSDVIDFGKWRKKLYKILSLHYDGGEKQNEQISKMRNLLSLLLVPLVIIISSILSWIFGMTLRPGWHSTIFGPYFVVAAIYSGVGAIIVAMYVFRRMYGLEKYFSNKHFTFMGVILIILGAGYGYFTFSEYLTSWYGSEKWDSEVMEKLLNPEIFGNWFLWSNLLGIIFPMFVMAIPKLRTPAWISFASLLIVLSMWVKRYLIVVPTLQSPLLPLQDYRPEYLHYSATWVEWSLTLGGVASFLLFFTLITKFITIIPVSELIGEKKEQKKSVKKNALPI